jgi:hypothetical protein
MVDIVIPDDATLCLESETKVPGYDGHSLRAFSYFPEKMPDIEEAPEGSRCFEVQIGGKKLWLHETELVTYLGQEMTGLEFWERLHGVRALV